MHIRVALTAGVLLATQLAPAAAQRTGDQARLVFSVSGAYIDGKGLWSVPNQPVRANNLQTDLALTRNIKNTFGASLGATYFPQANFGLTADAFFLALGYDDTCRVTSTGDNSLQSVETCQSIDQEEKSASAVAFSVGGVFRVAGREFISPFARASAGLLISSQSSLLTQGVSPSNNFALLILYDDDARTRIRPVFGLGIGATMVMSRGYHLRWEVRDNIIGVERVTGPSGALGEIPPHETAYKHLFSILIGLDIILERQRGRRY